MSAARTRYPHLEVTPVADGAGGAVRIEVCNAGTRPLRGVTVRLRPAPPGVPAARVDAVMPAATRSRPLPVQRLAPGAAAHVELPSPLRPGPLYARVLGLAHDDAEEEAVYGLPVETLLAIELTWRDRWRPWPLPPHRASLVRGEWVDGGAGHG